MRIKHLSSDEGSCCVWLRGASSELSSFERNHPVRILVHELLRRAHHVACLGFVQIPCHVGVHSAGVVTQAPSVVLRMNKLVSFSRHLSVLAAIVPHMSELSPVPGNF